MAERDLYGGWTELGFDATGYFRLDEVGGRWWFVSLREMDFYHMV